MVRQLLGNIRGPKGDTGDTGPKGDDGGFNGEMIGVNNLISLKDFEPYDASSSLSYNLTDGVIYYNNHLYSFGADIELTPGEYTFSVEDFTPNIDYNNGRIRFSITYDGVDQTSVSLNPGDTHSFTLTTSGSHRVNIRISNAPRVDGQVEKMMLVKGEYVSGWQPSLKDMGINKAYGIGRFYTTLELTSTERQLAVYAYTDGGIHRENNALISNGGPLMFSHTGHFLNWDDGFINIRLKVNDTTIVWVQATSNPVQLNHTIITQPGDEITLTLTYTGTDDLLIAPDLRNQFSIIEI